MKFPRVGEGGTKGDGGEARGRREGWMDGWMDGGREGVKEERKKGTGKRERKGKTFASFLVKA